MGPVEDEANQDRSSKLICGTVVERQRDFYSHVVKDQVLNTGKKVMARLSWISGYSCPLIKLLV